MDKQNTSSSSGTIAFIGSNINSDNSDYQRATQPLHKQLLGHIQGMPQVVVLPTALGRYPESKSLGWADTSVEYFRRLGAQVVPVMLFGREDAQKSEIVGQISRSNFVYISSGSDPEDDSYVAKALQNTPAWEAIMQVYRRGGVVAASTMAMGEIILSISLTSQEGAGLRVYTDAKLGLAPGLVLATGFFTSALQHRGWKSAIVRATSQYTQATLVVIDDLTALVGRQARWTVYGKGNVTVFEGKKEVRYSRGKEVRLPLPPP